MNRRRNFRKIARLLISSSILVSAHSAFAQQADAEQAGAQQAEERSTGVLGGTIVVTAQKREQDVQDVPVAISAYGGDQLDALNITSTTGIVEQVPGLNLTTFSPNATFFNLRGISQNNFTDNLEAPVAVYMDDAYMGSINGISGQLFDVERVEVLRGPQGTLFGRNATGGLIHYISRDASDDDLNGYVYGSIGSFDRYEIEGAVGGGLTEGVRLRVAGRYVNADGYIESSDALPGVFEGSGRSLGGEDGFAVRANLQLDITDNLTSSFWVKYSEDNDVPTGGYVLANCNPLPNGFCETDDAGRGIGRNGVFNGITGEEASPFEHFGERRGTFSRDTTILQAKFEYEFDSGTTITSITNLTDLSKFYQEDADGLPIPLVNFDTAADFRQFSQELRFAGSGDRLDWQAGLYYLDIDVDGQLVTSGAPIVGAALAVGLPGLDPTLDENYSLKSENFSVFGQIDYEIVDALTLTLGARYSMDNKSIDYLSNVIEGGATVSLASDELFETSIPGVSDIDYNDWAGRIALSYEASPETLLFVSANRGIKGGNWTLSANVTPDNFRHDEEVLYSYEAGIKTGTADGSLRVNATAFVYDYKDYQAFGIINFAPQVVNTDVTSYGGELEVFWSPSRNFDAVFGATYQHSDVDEIRTAGEAFLPELFPGAPDDQFCANQNDGSFFCDFPQDSVSSTELPLAPKISINYLLRYNFDALSGNIAAQVDGAFYDDQFLEVTNAPASLQEAYNVTNASLSWESSGGIVVTGFVKNLFEEEYAVYSLDLGGLGTTQVYGAPRTYGVSLRVPFGY